MDRADRFPAPPPPSPRWLILIHQLPASPHYLRVKVGRQLKDLGAVAIKNSVYVVPDAHATRPLLRRLVRDIQERGGHAVVCEARFVEGLSDETTRDLFRRALDGEFGAIGE